MPCIYSSLCDVNPALTWFRPRILTSVFTVVCVSLQDYEYCFLSAGRTTTSIKWGVSVVIVRIKANPLDRKVSQDMCKIRGGGVRIWVWQRVKYGIKCEVTA